MSDPAPLVPDFSVTTYNAHWGLTPAGDPYDLGSACAAFDTDLIVLQEVWNPDGRPSALGSIAAEGGYHLEEVTLAGSFVHPRPEITADPVRARGTWGLALLSRLPIRAVRTVELGQLPRSWDLARRVALVVDVDVGTTRVVVAAVHLSFVIPDAAIQLRRLGRSLTGGEPTVIVGDCNLWGAVASRLVPARRAVRAPTWPAHRPHSQLDHVLVSSHLHAVAGRALAPAGSDHLPVTATLRLRP